MDLWMSIRTPRCTERHQIAIWIVFNADSSWGRCGRTRWFWHIGGAAVKWCIQVFIEVLVREGGSDLSLRGGGWVH